MGAVAFCNTRTAVNPSEGLTAAREKTGMVGVTTSGPLAGVRVVEMAGIGPVPFRGLPLSDLGA